MTGAEWAARLPHEHPFRFVDRVVESEPGRAVAVRLVTSADPSMDESGWLPSVLLAESMAQVAGLAVGARVGEHALIAQMTRVRFRPGVRVGDELVLAARVLRRFGRIVKVRVVVRVGTRRCAAGDITLSFSERPGSGS